MWWLLLIVADPGTFQAQVYPALEEAGCRVCHSSEGVASATRLQFPRAGAKNDELEAFGKSLGKLVNRADPQESLLWAKPTGSAPHAGGKRLQPDSPAAQKLLAWIRELARLPEAEIDRAAIESKASMLREPRPRAAVRRLTHSQYANTIQDLLGDSAPVTLQFPPEDFVNGFKNQYQSQSLTPILLEAYGAAAERLARNSFQGGDTRRLIPCSPSPACGAEFVRTFGLRAFRRPLDPAEEARYAKLFASESEFYRGAQLVVEAMLQSPAFLFRLDESSDPRWVAYATASRLSYAIWDSMPDDELLRAASRNELSTRAQFDAQLARMMEDPRSQRSLNEFIAQWLRFDRLTNASKDRRRFPKYTRETAIAMTEEARRFFLDLVTTGTDFREFFRAPVAYPNADLAAIYGVPSPDSGFTRVSLPVESERAGVLGQAMFLAMTAKPDETSPTARGLFVREQFLCQHVPDPPPGTNTNLPEITEAAPKTNRERLAEHTTNAACASCHNLIDPIGHGFEKFDPIGARRETFEVRFLGADRGDGATEAKRVELPIQSDGFVAGLPDARFSSPRELGEVLARTPQCLECVVRQYFRFVNGRPDSEADRPAITRGLAAFRDSGYRFQEMMKQVLRSREYFE
jgi:hypothetical protein